jgi:hypothetical protein
VKPALLIAALALVSAGGDSRAAEVRGTVVAAPLAVELEVARADLRLGERIQVAASVRNLSAQTIAGVSLRLRSDPSGVVVLGPAQRRVGTLPAGEDGTRHWVICAAAPGNYVVLALAEWHAANGASMYSESIAAVIRVRADGRSNCPS